MKNIAKYLYVFLFDLIFTGLSIFALYYTRMQTKLYMDQITALSPVLNQFTEQAMANNITSVPLQEVIKLESLVNKALIINDWVLPILILVLFIVTQVFVWKLLNNTPLWKSSLFMLIPSVVFLITITNFTDLIFGIMSGENYSILLFVVLVLLSVILSYISLILLVHYEKPKDILKILKKKWKKSILPFILLILTSLIYLVLFTIVLISAIAEYLSFLTVLLMIIAIILFELTRYYFLKTVRG